MLHQVLTGKSFELILAVATVQGQLRTLVNRLIRFNECSKSGGDKARSQLFDITFLMLVAIVQNYGASAVLDPDGDSLFEQWVRSCMVERQKPKAPEQLLRLGSQNILDFFIIFLFIINYFIFYKYHQTNFVQLFFFNRISAFLIIIFVFFFLLIKPKHKSA